MTDEQERKVGVLTSGLLGELEQMFPAGTPMEDFIAALCLVIDELQSQKACSEEEL